MGILPKLNAHLKIVAERDGNIQWFVLNYIPSIVARHETAEAVVGRFNKVNDEELELFAPTFVKMVETGGKLKRIETPLMFHYVFVRRSLGCVKDLCSQTNGFAFVLSHLDSPRYLSITDQSMEAFKTVARYYANQIPCFSTEEIDLEEGDYVEVVQGAFSGLKGRYISKKRGRSGNLLIAVTQDLAATVYAVKADYLRVLEFAKNSKRAYDQVEAFIPRLFAAMRVYRSGGKLDAGLIAPLVVFCRRFDSVKFDNAKFEAKLQLLLMTACKILGDADGFRKAQASFEKLAVNLTNRWTKALAALCLSVMSCDAEGIAPGREFLPESSAGESKAQAELRAEYEYYLADKS